MFLCSLDARLRVAGAERGPRRHPRERSGIRPGLRHELSDTHAEQLLSAFGIVGRGRPTDRRSNVDSPLSSR